VIDILQGAMSGEVSKEEMRQALKECLSGLDSAVKFLGTVDRDKLLGSIREKLPAAVKKSYADGKISSETVESARKMSIIFPSALSEKLYNLQKQMYEYCRRQNGETP
jgi:hypothetical protein